MSDSLEPHTIRNHVHSILEKLGVRRRGPVAARLRDGKAPAWWESPDIAIHGREVSVSVPGAEIFTAPPSLVMSPQTAQRLEGKRELPSGHQCVVARAYPKGKKPPPYFSVPGNPYEAQRNLVTMVAGEELVIQTTAAGPQEQAVTIEVSPPFEVEPRELVVVPGQIAKLVLRGARAEEEQVIHLEQKCEGEPAGGLTVILVWEDDDDDKS